MINLNILIVEDEVLIAQTIQLYLKEKDYHVCSICISYQEAIEAYHLYNPDLVLLDIRLYGEKSGIDIAKYLQALDHGPPFLFLTSQHDKRILDEAISTMPYGYIAKPLQKETLWTSIEAAMKLYKFHSKVESKLELIDGKNRHLIKVSDIMFIETDHVYSNIYLVNDIKLIVRYSLIFFQEKLDPDHFIRCHRSYMINKKFISSWNKEEITMADKTKIPIGKTNRDKTLEMIK
ncbi:MAG TPA: response regulator transcription factor [Saprospiraceae bacterium]|nr:response regulator transcription factor [Saprospiraceae bacterium]